MQPPPSASPQSLLGLSFNPGPSPGDMAHIETQRMNRDYPGTAGPELSPVQGVQPLPTFPLWTHYSPLQPQQPQIYDPSLIGLRQQPMPRPSRQTPRLFAGESASSTPSAALSALSLPTPLPSSPAFTYVPFPTLILSKKHNKDELATEFIMLCTRIGELEQRLQNEITSKSQMKQAFDATVAHLRAEFDRGLAEVKRYCEEKMADGGTSNSSSESESEEEGASAKGGAEESKSAAAHASIKNLTKETFFLFLGTRNLKVKEDFPAFETGEHAFIDGSKEIRQICLNWESTAKHADNVDALSTMATYARSAGPNIVASSKDLLPVISNQDLIDRFHSHFEGLRRNFKGTAGRSKTAPARQVPETDTGGDIAMNKTKFLNRANGKLAIRKRKRASASIPAKLKWVQDPKYDMAFEVNHMSDDEDLIENGKLAKGKYCARRPTHRSDEAQRLFDAVDSVTDPDPSTQFLTRVRGAPKEQVIRKVTTFSKRGRRWMYNAKWLEDNPTFNSEGYVLDNGVLWGDPTDPVEREELKKAVKETKKEKKEKKRKSSEGGGGANKKKKGA